MKTVFFQLVCGASGDMILSSLLDLGVPVDFLQNEMARLGIEGLSLEVEKVKRAGIACSHMRIACGEEKSYRRLPQILEVVHRGGYGAAVNGMCERVLERLAAAEAKVHGIAVEEVHFHEIGAVDTIVDIVGTCICLQHLGVEQVCFSDLMAGRGIVEADHGTMPVPSPATAEMIQGFRVAPLDIDGEILTPTGAAILTALGRQARSFPEGTIVKVGYGCGDKVFEHHPNALRALLCEAQDAEACGAQHDSVCVMESDMDHVSGEIMAFAAEEILKRGALDVSWAPIFMKKGRPAYRLCVMCREEDRDTIADCIIANTHSLGVRYRTMRRLVASRRSGSSRLGGEEIEVKHCAYKTSSFTKPEYEALARLARERNVPLIELVERFLKQER